MAAGLAASVLAVFVLDRFFETPHLLRLALLLAGLCVVIWAALDWLRHWVFHPRDDRAMSILVQKHHRRLGDTLLSAVELTEGRITDDAISPELRQAAISSIASQAAQVDFTRAVRWRTCKRLALCVGALGLALIGLGWFSPSALSSTLTRWINPFTSLGRHTFTRFAPLDPVRIVARGEPFEVACSCDPESEWKPKSIAYQCGPSLPSSVDHSQPVHHSSRWPVGAGQLAPQRRRRRAEQCGFSRSCALRCWPSMPPSSCPPI